MLTTIITIEKKSPSYGELIDLLSDAEQESKEHATELLASKFHQIYPIGRPARFFDTVTRLAAPTRPSMIGPPKLCSCLAAPTRPSLIGPPKLCGSPLSSYRRREWIPRIRNPTAAEGIHN